MLEACLRDARIASVTIVPLPTKTPRRTPIAGIINYVLWVGEKVLTPLSRNKEP